MKSRRKDWRRVAADHRGENIDVLLEYIAETDCPTALGMSTAFGIPGAFAYECVLVLCDEGRISEQDGVLLVTDKGRASLREHELADALEDFTDPKHPEYDPEFTAQAFPGGPADRERWLRGEKPLVPPRL